MSEPQLITCTYRILRYVPNLLRDEWINVGILFFDPGRNGPQVRAISETNEFARLHRIHPDADDAILRSLEEDLNAQAKASEDEPVKWVEKLEETLSNVLQLGPKKAVLTEDPDAELERLYSAQVLPPKSRGRWVADFDESRPGLTRKASEVFRSAGIYSKLQRRIAVAEFTFPEDPMRLDYAYRENGTRGFVHVIPLLRDPGLALSKSFSFTAGQIRARAGDAKFHAITENEPRTERARYDAIAQFLWEQKIEVVPAQGLREFAGRLSTIIH